MYTERHVSTLLLEGWDFPWPIGWSVRIAWWKEKNNVADNEKNIYIYVVGWYYRVDGTSILFFHAAATDLDGPDTRVEKRGDAREGTTFFCFDF